MMKSMMDKGISLLEVLLSLAIIGIILILVTRYYNSTRTSQMTNETIGIIQNLTAAADNWYWTNKSFTAPTPISLTQLQQMGLVPEKQSKSPWGGDINIEPDNGRDPNHVSILIPNVPYQVGPPAQGACLNLQEILTRQNLKATCSATGLTITYPSN